MWRTLIWSNLDARELFDVMDEEDLKEGYTYSYYSSSSQPKTSSRSGEANNNQSTASSPPMMSLSLSVSPPTPVPLPKRPSPGPPPPPPLTKSLQRKAAVTKLKRSTKMINLFRNLKRDVEGSNSLKVNSAHGTKIQIGGSSIGGKQGLADSIAELTKRSYYFQQIEEDVRKHGKSIMELKIAINSFQAKEMDKLLKFQKSVDSFLEGLTDETQVLAKFEEFPTKKLEAMRTAAALHLKLDTIVTNLKGWEIVAPLEQLLDNVEPYFNKIKREFDAIERIKDDESKTFKCHNIHFDFNILTRIKELMVDVSSSCMELALKERREAKAATANGETESITCRKRKGSVRMLWRAFQLAFRVYTFAGGQDDRAEKLAEELAHEISPDS